VILTDLTTEQKAKIEAIRKQLSPKLEAAAKQMQAVGKEMHEKIDAVLTAEQKAKLAKAFKPMQPPPGGPGPQGPHHHGDHPGGHGPGPDGNK